MEGAQRFIVTPRLFQRSVLPYQIDDVDPCFDVIGDGHEQLTIRDTETRCGFFPVVGTLGGMLGERNRPS